MNRILITFLVAIVTSIATPLFAQTCQTCPQNCDNTEGQPQFSQAVYVPQDFEFFSPTDYYEYSDDSGQMFFQTSELDQPGCPAQTFQTPSYQAPINQTPPYTTQQDGLSSNYQAGAILWTQQPIVETLEKETSSTQLVQRSQQTSSRREAFIQRRSLANRTAKPERPNNFQSTLSAEPTIELTTKEPSQVDRESEYLQYHQSELPSRETSSRRNQQVADLSRREEPELATEITPQTADVEPFRSANIERDETPEAFDLGIANSFSSPAQPASNTPQTADVAPFRSANIERNETPEAFDLGIANSFSSPAQPALEMDWKDEAESLPPLNLESTPPTPQLVASDESWLSSPTEVPLKADFPAAPVASPLVELNDTTGLAAKDQIELVEKPREREEAGVWWFWLPLLLLPLIAWWFLRAGRRREQNAIPWEPVPLTSNSKEENFGQQSEQKEPTNLDPELFTGELEPTKEVQDLRVIRATDSEISEIDFFDGLEDDTLIGANLESNVGTKTELAIAGREVEEVEPNSESDRTELFDFVKDEKPVSELEDKEDTKTTFSSRETVKEPQSKKTEDSDWYTQTESESKTESGFKSELETKTEPTRLDYEEKIETDDYRYETETETNSLIENEKDENPEWSEPEKTKAKSDWKKDKSKITTNEKTKSEEVKTKFESEKVESEKADLKPVQTKPVQTKPVQTKPVQTKPVQTKPVQTKPVEPEKVETEIQPVASRKIQETSTTKPEPATATDSRSKKPKTSKDDFTLIDGIDAKTQSALYSAGYTNFADLRSANKKDLKRALSRSNCKFTSSQFKRWKKQAADAHNGTLTSTSESTTDKQPGSLLQLGVDAGSTPEPSTQSASTSATESSSASTSRPDDLTKIRGIGSAAAKLLRSSGIESFEDLRETKVERLQSILTAGGKKFVSVDPADWAEQAKFAVNGNWSGLENWHASNDLKSKSKSERLKPENETTKISTSSESNQTAESKPTESKKETTLATESRKAVKSKKPESTESTATDSAKSTSQPKRDDLTKIRGIGAAASELLRKSGIDSYPKLRDAETGELKRILASAGTKFDSLDPSNWPDQAKFATRNDWDGLKEWLASREAEAKSNTENNTALNTNKESSASEEASLNSTQIETINESTANSQETLREEVKSEREDAKSEREDAKSERERTQPTQSTSSSRLTDQEPNSERDDQLEEAKAAPKNELNTERTEKTETVEANEELTKDDLTKIRGIGSAASELLKKSGIDSYARLHETSPERLKEILADAGTKFKFVDPTDWPKQAGFAAKGDWDGLVKWQTNPDGFAKSKPDYNFDLSDESLKSVAKNSKLTQRKNQAKPDRTKLESKSTELESKSTEPTEAESKPTSETTSDATLTSKSSSTADVNSTSTSASTSRKETAKQEVEPTDYSSAPDDLKAIHGIGPAAERHLNSKRIWKYEQLAAMTSEQITELFAEKSRFKLLRTANWPTEARQFALDRDGSLESEVLAEIQSLTTMLNTPAAPSLPTTNIVNPQQTMN